MSRPRQCPFCLSLSVVETERAARLIDCSCGRCHKYWTEARASLIRGSEEQAPRAGTETPRDVTAARTRSRRAG
jgi:hypothetical protein